MNRRIGVMLCSMLGACAAKPSSTPAPALVDGIYRFSERPSQLSQSIEGTLTILRDTVMVDAQPGPCRYDDKQSWGNAAIVYRCAELTVSVERSNPIRNAKYQMSTTVDERKTVCTRYETTTSGQQICVQHETQIVPRQVTINGLLHPIRVAKPDQPPAA